MTDDIVGRRERIVTMGFPSCGADSRLYLLEPADRHAVAANDECPIWMVIISADEG